MRKLLLVMGLVLIVSSSILQASPAAATSSEADIQQIQQDYQRQGMALQWRAEDQVARRILMRRGAAAGMPKGQGSPVEIARDFLGDHSAVLFGSDRVSLPGRISDTALPEASRGHELVATDLQETASGSHIWLRQFVDGVPVEGAYIKVNLRPDGQVSSVFSEYRAGLERRSVTPSISGDAALARARTHLNPRSEDRADPVLELVLLRSGELAWKTITFLWAPHGDWLSYVDARSGRILETRNDLIHGKPIHEAPDIAPHVDRQQVPARSGGYGKVDGSGLVLPANPLNGFPDRYGLRDGDPVDAYRESKTLFRLDGSGFMRGDYSDVDNTDAPRANEATLIFNYSADLVNSNFHEANAYWHIDVFQQYMQDSLGIFNANNKQQACFVHQGEDDNSDYSPSLDRIRWGDGGVDDSEDGEIVLHEYGHAVHENMIPGFVYAGESGATSEGFGDYLACTFGDNPLEGEWDATSYNPGPPPYLRRLDNTKHYPEDIVNQVHADGTIIAGAWWDLRNIVGALVADQLIIESFNIIGTNNTFEDFANATVEVDQALNGGAHLGAIYSAYGGRGIGPDYLLEIVHTPLGDTEDTAGPYTVDIAIGHTSPITGPDAVQLHYRLAGDPSYTSMVMASSGVDMWTGDIPGPGADATVEYYTTVTDDNAVSAADPPSAPTDVHSFDVGTDTQAPVIVHTPLNDQALLLWPSTVNATVTDNLGLASVTLSWTLNGAPQANIAMADMGGDLYSGVFADAGAAIGDVVEYSITAVDGSSAANTTVDGPHTFDIIDAAGVVLIVDDDSVAKRAEDIKYDDDKNPIPTGPERDPAMKGAAAAAMAADLTAVGYVVTVEDVASSDPGTWGSYSFIISSSGQNNAPVEDASYRQALEDYVAAGGKLLVEGGEVGYDAVSFPGYPSFATNVLHSLDWDGDYSGNMPGWPGTESHPIRTIPNALPDPILVTNSGDFGDMDSIEPLPDAYHVYGTDDEPENAGVLVYDDNGAPESAQIVVFYSAYTQMDAAAALLENTAAFLLAEESAADASISGTVVLDGVADWSGVTVSAEPGGGSVVTGPDGTYTLGPLFGNTYTVTASPPAGWETASQSVTVASGQDLTGVDFVLRTVETFYICSNPELAIPDSDPLGVKDTLVFTEMGEIVDVECSVNLTHTWRGDLILELTSPEGTVVRLHNRSGSSTDDIITSYDDLTEPDGPGVMADFNGEDPLGGWSMFVSDNAGGDTGTLHEWCLTITVAHDPVVSAAVSGFGARNVTDGVELRWETLASDGISGFHVWRQVKGGSSDRLTDELLRVVDGPMSFVDRAEGIDPGDELSYTLELVGKTGDSQFVGDQVALEFAPPAPKVFALNQNFPNPFNPKTTIRFSLPARGATTVRIFDVAGRLVTELVNEELTAGVHDFAWTGIDGRGKVVGAGTYFYRVRSGSHVATKSMVLVK